MLIRSVIDWLKHLVTDPVGTMRWLIALWYDRDPRTCWAELAIWAAGHQSWWGLRDKMYYHGCTRVTGVYCGKCWRTGRLTIPDENIMTDIDEAWLDTYLDALGKMPGAPTQKDIERLEAQVLAKVRGSENE